MLPEAAEDGYTAPESVEGDARHAPDAAPHGLIWSGIDNKSVVFLPEALLAEKGLEELPMTEIERAAFRQQAELHRNRPEGFCEGYPYRGMVQGSDPDAVSLAELIGSSSSSFSGTVLRLEGGWSPWLRHVATRATIRIDEVLHDPKQLLPPVGEEIRLVLRGGRFRYGETDLCERPRAGSFVPEVDDEVLVAGEIWDDRRFLNYKTIFPVVEGMVQTVPYPSLEGRAIPRGLELLRDEVRETVETP